MPSSDILTAIEAVCTRSATAKQQQDVLSALSSGNISVARGERSLAVGDNISNSEIITGDGNLLCQISVDDERALIALFRQFHPLSLHQLPNDLSDFTGRAEEVSGLLERLSDGGGAAAISALDGLGGIGKSALAIRVGHLLALTYPAGQLLLELGGTSDTPISSSDVMTQVIRSFHPAAQLPEDEAGLLPIYRDLLSTQKVLLILDNARDAAQVRALLPPPPSVAIITSRQPIALENVTSQLLGVLSEDEARSLLLEILGSERATDDDLGHIASACGYLPLALRAAGTFLRLHPAWTVEEYLGQLRDEKTRLKSLTVPDHELDVAATLSLSVDQLNAEAPALVLNWRKLTVYAGDFDRRSVAAVWDCEEVDARDGLDTLLNQTLVQYDTDTGRFRLHDLMRDVALLDNEAPQIEVALNDAATRHAVHFCIVLSEANDLYQKGGDGVLEGLKFYDLYEANIAVGHDWAVSQLEQSEGGRRLCYGYASGGVYVLSLRLLPRDHIAWQVAALKGAQASGNRRGEGNALRNLGMVYNRLSEYAKAIEHHEQALAIAREIGDRRGEGASLGNLGNPYHNLGEYAKAIECHEQALAIARETGSRESEEASLGNLGNTYHNLGKYAKAIEYYEQALAIGFETGNRQGQGNALGNLGSAYGKLGKYPKAIEHHEQALAIAREIGDRGSEGNALGNLGAVYNNLGEYPKAIECLEQALAISREIGDRQGEGNDLDNMGTAYGGLGKYPKAIEHHEQALAIAREIGDRGSEGNALGNLGSGYGRLGKYPKAIECHEQALAISLETGDRRGEGSCLYNMAVALRITGETERAIGLAENALKIVVEIGSPHAEVIRQAILNWGQE